MDKREFYKQLMSQYTFDEAKIRKNAKRKHPHLFLNSKWMPVTAAAAVFVAVFASYMVVPPLLGGLKGEQENVYPDPAILSAAGVSSVSAGERLADMEYNDYLIKNNIMSAYESKTMYISFENSLTRNEYAAVLETYVSDTGEIVTISLWNGSFVDISVAGENVEYLAAKVNAPVSLYGKLIECPAFSGVDFENKIKDDNFEPFVSEAADDDYVSSAQQMTSAAQAVTTPSDSYVPDNAESSESWVGDTYTTVSGIIEEAGGEALTETVHVETTDAGEEYSDETTVSESETAAETMESTVNTAGSLEIKLLSIPVSDVVDVEFVNNDHFLVLTADNIALYRITDEFGYAVVADYDVSNPKISYVNWGTNTLIILDENRTELYIADGASCRLVKVDTSSITSNANISCAYSGGEGVFIKTIATDSSYNAFYLASDKGGVYGIDELERFTDKTSVISFNNESFVYAVTGGDGTIDFRKVNYRNGAMYKLDIEVDGDLSFVRSHDLTNFAILNKLEQRAWIWNSQKECLTQEFSTDTISFSEFNSDVFTDGTSWYEIWGSDVHSISAGEANALSNKPVMSSTYRINDITDIDLKFEVRQ